MLHSFALGKKQMYKCVNSSVFKEVKGVKGVSDGVQRSKKPFDFSILAS